MTLQFSDEEKLWGRISVESKEIKKIQINTPQYLYSEGQTNLLVPIKGISNVGPYDFNTTNFSLKRKFDAIKIIPFVPVGAQKVRESLSKLIEYLTNGYYEQRGSYDANFRGLKQEFRLTDVSVYPEIIEYGPGSLSSVLEKIELDVEQLRSQKIIPIAIVGGPSHKSIKENREIYSEVKFEFIKRDLPSQFASLYESDDSKLGILPAVSGTSLYGYSVWNFAVNIYGKCGGIPWTILQSKNSQGDSLVDLTIGIRFVGKYSGDGKGYYIGQAVIFDHYGKFIGSFASEPFDITSHELKSSGMVVPQNIMKKILKDAIELANTHPVVGGFFSSKDSLNIAIHRQSLFHNEEIKGIELAISEQQKYSSIRYALVGISPEPYVMMIPEISTSKPGECVVLSKNTALIYTARPGPGQPVSNPILIVAQNLNDPKNPFSGISAVCRHIVDFTGMHWQTAIPNTVQLPSTLQFAANIGKNYSHGIYPKKNSWLWFTTWFL